MPQIIFVRAKRKAGGNDAFTKLLLHFDGADGATTFTDSSAANRTISLSGDPEIDTAQSKFGGASGLFNNGYLQAPDDADLEFGSSDFTMDMWIRSSSFAGGYHPICLRGTASDYYTGFHHNGTSLYFTGTTNNAGYNFSALSAITGVTLATNTWHHIAAVRSGNNLYLFFDGTLKETRNVTGLSVYNFGHGWCIGANASGTGPFAGWIDELRISVGIARWTANFTPPTAPYI
ncbi:MAG: LamG domain-containing protein [Xanthobacteraceae bacterium]|nr:LamG domain-containing protein [Xanthobacteraceae bacterium]